MTEVTNEIIAEMIGYKPCACSSNCYALRTPDGKATRLKEELDFFTPDGLAEVKADIEASTNGAYAIESYTVESSDYGIMERWREATVWLNGRKGKGESTVSEAEALLEAYAAAKKEGSR